MTSHIFNPYLEIGQTCHPFPQVSKLHRDGSQITLYSDFIRPQKITIFCGNEEAAKLMFQTIDMGQLQKMNVRIDNVRHETEYL